MRSSIDSKFKAEVENQTSKKIKVFKSNNGEEYASNGDEIDMSIKVRQQSQWEL